MNWLTPWIDGFAVIVELFTIMQALLAIHATVVAIHARRAIHEHGVFNSLSLCTKKRRGAYDIVSN